MSDMSKAVFSATIPPILSGIKTGGDGMRVQFDIPETDMGESAKLLMMRGKRLKVSVEVEVEPKRVKNEQRKYGGKLNR